MGMNMDCRPKKATCCPETPCKDSCKIYTSQIIYDGEDIPEACIRNGDPLNVVIGNLARVTTGIMKKSSQVNHESFQGFSGGDAQSDFVKLKYVPDKILLVTYCGGILGEEMYRVRGRNLLFSKKFCRGGDFDDIQVVYRSAYVNDFESPCFGY